jgi:hypothetical protein
MAIHSPEERARYDKKLNRWQQNGQANGRLGKIRRSSFQMQGVERCQSFITFYLQVLAYQVHTRY